MTASIAATVPSWTLGDRLRKAREHAGMEQGELAERIGISRGTVSNYELNRGTRPPKVVVLRAWANECNVPYEWIVDNFHGSTTRVSSPFTGELMSSPRPGRCPVPRDHRLNRYRYRFTGNQLANLASPIAS